MSSKDTDTDTDSLYGDYRLPTGNKMLDTFIMESQSLVKAIRGLSPFDKMRRLVGMICEVMGRGKVHLCGEGR